MGILRHNTDRGGLVLLFALLALVSVALLGLGPDAGVAQAQDENVRVTGEGLAGFSSAHGSHVPVCEFLVDATRDEAGSRGSFGCELSDHADSLGLPFTSITVEITGVEAPSEQEAILQGPALVEVPDGEPIEGVPATVLLHAGGAGAGGLRINLEGVFDGERGDETPGDGDYSLLPQDVTEGSILIELEAPGPSPSPSVTPTGTPTPSPSGSPSPSPSGSPSPRPSPTSSLPPPGPPGPVPVGPPTGPPDVPFTLGGTHSTARLMAMLGQLSPDGIPRLDDILSVVGPFPVAGLAWWQDDWHAHRCCPRPHLHQGLDLFAPRGTPVVAAVDGYVSQKVNGAVSGLAVEITDEGNTQYFYGHLSAFASGISAGTRVRMGQIVGYIGNTGNAARTSPHLHFEIQPNGIPVPPMPIVDRWLGLSEQRALALVMERTGGSFPDADTIREWIGKALALAGHDASGELSGETAPQGRSRPASAFLDLHPSGPLAAFAAGALFIMILMPAVLGGLRDARRALGRSRGGPRAETIAEETMTDGELSRVDQQSDPGGAGRHRPAAR